ncbi:Threonine dehydrogenase [Pseudonocardia sp. Ae168_Ps1]|uniref:zinc-dependent alcohol dehydrogenase family protein n=1 Tax=unclassified Pseudonocardia TaxID=2619320 RepID=UPI00094ACA90|nr:MULTISPECIES: zinc-dependent alcohol dehydrogenase family protein [unclassified Pseudonocardia]OLL71200.1 Threonine dehydrogenase [Pseudonocardia sp. Ae168_Ps1]OLL77248.1 Threonine dehydrogenase [Pseudonocardia sp. Ae150A_Ps1]OLL88643.1 Threonine dehydrogenase [Pseudonocardia sp. Ae263_Ps1]OLL91336.1 Threonine dehydrogenase [Pseudonocardia sp. Ae356_Ps1]
MKATLIHGTHDIRVSADVPDPRLRDDTDAIVRVVRSCICGSDLWPYNAAEDSPEGKRIGHEFLGVVEEVGAGVRTTRKGQLVVAPFVWADNTCDFCAQGLQTSCRHGGGWGADGTDGGQGEAVRVPFADGTLVPMPGEPDDALLASMLTLSDVFSTGHHAAVSARVRRGDTVAVVGDGAVGLSAVLAANRLGAERIILLGRHTDRTDLGREFGAADVVAERGDEGIERVRELTGGDGVHVALECVGFAEAVRTAVGITRDGGLVGRVGVSQYTDVPLGVGPFMRNVGIVGGVAPARAYIEELLPDVLDGTVEPGRVFDRTIGLDDVPDGYRAMNEREALKVLIAP